ncbi:DUF5959 family protein [Streptomyces sp. NPDC090112]|uniref:DUF5959 family protein n=1 Tax=Streptomyces sp. NPDC090112 TaxID=3365949 RepID=UPI00381ABFAA
MGENAAGDLIWPVDTDSSVRVRVPGRNRPGATPYNDHLDAELVISSVFVSGRLGLCLSPEAMDHWSTALNELSDRRAIRWRAMGDTNPPSS